MSLNVEYNVTVLENDGDFALARVCMLDENGKEVPGSVRFIIFQLPEWSQVLQSSDEPFVRAEFKKCAKVLPNQAAAVETAKDNLSSRSASTKGPQPWD